MLSRVAENMYWMARYVERAEDTARLVTVNANLLLDLPRGIAPGWRPMVDICGANAQFEERYGEYSERHVLRFLLGDTDNPGSVLSALTAARESCRTIRDAVPREGWEQINELYLFAKDNLAAGITKGGRHTYLKRIVVGAQTITGLLAGTMSHDLGYDFIRIGRNLERADMTSRIIDVRSADLLQTTSDLRPFDTIQWVSVLKSLTGYQMYRRSMQVAVSRAQVLKFLFQGRDFPRAFLHCVDAVEVSIAPLPKPDAPLRVVARVKRTVQETDVGQLELAALHQFVDDLQLGLTELHTELAGAYFLPEAGLRTAAAA